MGISTELARRVIRDLPNWAYVHLLFAVMPSRNGMPLDRARIENALRIALPRGRREPDIYLNAAFCYLELDELDEAVEYLRQAKKGGVNLTRYLRDPTITPFADDKRIMESKPKIGRTKFRSNPSGYEEARRSSSEPF